MIAIGKVPSRRSPPGHQQINDHVSLTDELKDKLEDYIKCFGGIVRLKRAPERQGLIRAKLMGAKEATGDVVVFLDSHCEVTKGWWV